jgi:hypothetical protein
LFRLKGNTTITSPVDYLKLITSEPKCLSTLNPNKYVRTTFLEISGRNLSESSLYEALVEQEKVEGPRTSWVILNRISCIFKMGKVDESSWKNTNGVGAFHINTAFK